MIKFVFRTLFISLILILITDFVFGKLILTKLDKYLATTDFYERLIRIDHPYYHHTLKANVKYKKAKSFNSHFTLCTDNHGFKFECDKKRGKIFDYAFMGDSFVEGVALKYSETFVGIFEKKKNISVANLGVTSYSPSIYLSKIKFLLENNYKFKNVVVFIDISDLYDDNVFYLQNFDLSVSEKNAKEKNLKRRKFLKSNFPLLNFYTYVIKMNQRINKEVPPLKSKVPIFTKKADLKAAWTYSKSDSIPEYVVPVSNTQLQMIDSMTILYELLKKNNIKLSLAVYPWPQQIEFDTIDSKHVKMWEEFCLKKCEKFINFFPLFFEEKKNSSYLEVYKKYYFWNDVHFNKKGNKLIADRLIGVFN
jgi:hypothetical protein